MDGAAAAIRELEERLRRYPRDRYPVQHAVARFHLGLALAKEGRLAEAEDALTTAAELFDPDGLPVEHAKALNALGATLRMAGRHEEAAAAFEHAAARFAAADLGLERGAALYNLGLIQRELGDARGAAARFHDAWELLAAAPAHRAAAGRELGATLLALRDLEEAVEALERALTVADAAGETAELGAAANTLGLAHLAAGAIAAAVDALRRAASAHPRGVRPHDYAMAKANLALAYEQAGDGPRARLAARQALGVRDVPDAVSAQARGVLARLADGTDDLLRVLDEEPQERWLPIVREEVARWTDAEPARRARDAAAFVDGVLARPAAGTELAEAWLGALLEVPPEALETLVEAALTALADRAPDERERFRTDVSAATARFYTPQLMRLKDTFARVAASLGQEW